MWVEQSKLLFQLRTSKADSGRVQVLLNLGKYYMLREYYLYKTGNPRAQLDSASFFAEQALRLSRALKYVNGENEAILVKGDILIRKQEIGSALNLLSTVHDSTRFRLLVTLARHYLFHTDRTKKDLDSSLYFLELANKVSLVELPAKWRLERIHVQGMHYYITHGLQQSKKQYLELIEKISGPGNEQKEALLWHELSTFIPLREKAGLTRLYCFEKMHLLYKKCGNQEREAWVLKTIADIHLVNGKLDLAETELLEAIELYKAIGYRNLHYIYDLLAITYRNKGDFSKCIFYGLKSIESTEATNDSTSATTFYRRLANMYRELGQSDKSVEWYSRILNDRVFKDGDNVYKFRDASLFARELIKIKREKEALSYILDINAKNKPIGIYAEACLVSSLAYCYQAANQERHAESYYLELIELAGQLEKDNEITTDVYFELGQYFVSKLQYEKALAYLQDALIASENSGSLSLKKDIHLMLYRADSGMGNWNSATQHLLRHKVLSDSIFNETKNWQIEELQVQFETAKKQKDIELLNSRYQLQRIRLEEVNRTKDIILTAVVLLLIIIGLLLNRYHIKQRNNRTLKAHERELDQKNMFLETLNSEQEKLLKEREWLIKEVHHRVKNNLQMVISLLNSQSAHLKEVVAINAIDESKHRIEAISMLHQRIYQSESMVWIEMRSYIQELVYYLESSFNLGGRIIFSVNVGNIELDLSQAVPVGLILNEAITNSLKYAFPEDREGKILVELKEAGQQELLLTISDDGIGFSSQVDIDQSTTFGLKLIKGLSEDLDGTFRLLSACGTKLSIAFPLKLMIVSSTIV